jgi:DNA (cytosine-5)-methyltransferase 1
MPTLRYLSLFSGIGGFEIGIQRAVDSRSTSRDGASDVPEGGTDPAGGSLRAECVGYSEIDRYAIETYKKHFGGHTNYGDATTIDETRLPDFDLLVGGFPCQAFSVAGKRKGFDDTRGTLFFDIARILKHKRPRHFILENVKGLLSHNGGETVQTIFRVLADLGYGVEWCVLNSKEFGVPQSRERIFIVGHLRTECGSKIFPLTRENTTALGGDESFVDLQLEGAQTTRTSRTIQARYYKGYSKRYGENSGVISGTLRTHNDGKGFREVKSGLAPTIPARARNDGSGQPVIMQKARGKNGGGEHRTAPAVTGKSYQDNNHVAVPVLTPERVEKRQNGRRFKNNNDPAFTVNTQDQHGVYDGIVIRRLTPRECERLMGYPDDWTAGISDTQRYKQCGNGIVSNVVEAVVKALIDHGGAA